MSVALMTLAQRITWQAFNADGVTFNGPAFKLEIQNTDVSKNTSIVDFTNSESFGYAEFAPTVTMTQWQLTVVIDDGGAFDSIFASQDAKVFGQIILYMTKTPELDPNPVTYTGKVLIEKSGLKGKVDQNGDVWRGELTGRNVGKLVRAGVGYTGAKVVGYPGGV